VIQLNVGRLSAGWQLLLQRSNSLISPGSVQSMPFGVTQRKSVRSRCAMIKTLLRGSGARLDILSMFMDQNLNMLNHGTITRDDVDDDDYDDEML